MQLRESNTHHNNWCDILHRKIEQLEEQLEVTQVSDDELEISVVRTVVELDDDDVYLSDVPELIQTLRAQNQELSDRIKALRIDLEKKRMN